MELQNNETICLTLINIINLVYQGGCLGEGLQNLKQKYRKWVLILHPLHYKKELNGVLSHCKLLQLIFVFIWEGQISCKEKWLHIFVKLNGGEL